MTNANNNKKSFIYHCQALLGHNYTNGQILMMINSLPSLTRAALYAASSTTTKARAAAALMADWTEAL